MRAKNVGKTYSGKSAKKTFYILTRISCPKNGGEKRVRQFYQQHSNSASNKCWGKIVRKSAKKRFLYSHEYDYKKCGKKTRETIFPETHE